MAKHRSHSVAFKRQELPIGDAVLLFGDVLHVHADDRVIVDGRIDPELMQPVGRLAGSQYAVVEKIRRLQRPKWPPVSEKVTRTG